MSRGHSPPPSSFKHIVVNIHLKLFGVILCCFVEPCIFSPVGVMGCACESIVVCAFIYPVECTLS